MKTFQSQSDSQIWVLFFIWFISLLTHHYLDQANWTSSHSGKVFRLNINLWALLITINKDYSIKLWSSFLKHAYNVIDHHYSRTTLYKHHGPPSYTQYIYLLLIFSIENLSNPHNHGVAWRLRKDGSAKDDLPTLWSEYSILFLKLNSRDKEVSKLSLATCCSLLLMQSL